MADIIKLLPNHVANQIAAGEVVQRPASVVKELLENAIDAKATTIKLIIKNSGKTLIQVTDNGVGMSTTDARLSFERHATSKIRAAEDLFQLHTKGFRGEALASIAAIAHVALTTKQENDQIATQIQIEGSKVITQEPIVATKGTTISVKNLFFNIPARRNFLKSDAVELRHTIDEFHRVALAHPNIHFQMYHNGNELFNLPFANHRQRIVHIFGTKTNEKLVPVTENTPVVNISGFIGKPQYAKKTRGQQFFFVNNRFIKSPYLHHAVIHAFEGLIKEQTYPSYFLFLEINPESIDINIHPTKTEIKFDDEHTLYAILKSAIKHSLGQFQVAPILDFEKDANLDIPYTYKNKEATTPNIKVDANFNPFKDDKTFKKESNTAWESLYVGLATNENTSEFQIESEEVTGSLFTENEEIEATTYSTFQVQRKYIITKIKSGLVVIHQHRAHQRILYEQFLKQITVAEITSQQLLFPLEIQYTSTEIQLITELKENLEQMGFVFDAITQESIKLNAIPVLVSEKEISTIFNEIIADFQENVPETSFSQADKLAKIVAKSIAVKSGIALNSKLQENLVNDLFMCKDPNMSPFQKPTFTTITTTELDKKFL